MDDIIDVRNVKNVTNINENVTNLTDVTNIKNVRNINQETVERIDEVITDVNKITRDTVNKTTSLVDRRDDTVIYDRIDINKTKITDDTTIVKKVRNCLLFRGFLFKIDFKFQTDDVVDKTVTRVRDGPKDKPKKPVRDHNEQCICEICTCG